MMEYISLNKICDVRDGTHDSPQYVLSGYPLVTSKNIVDGKLDLSTVNYLSQEDYDKINARSKVDIGDIIMPMIGTIGNPFLVNEDPNYAIKNVALIKFPNKDISNRFIWYFLKSGAFKKYVSEKNKGGTQKFLSLGDIRNMNVPLVALDNQLEIVEKLDVISQIIDKKRLELIALDRLIKARFVEMFGEGLADDGKYPLIPISEIGKVVSGATPKTSIDEYWDGDNLWITPAEISDETFVVSDTVRKITDEGVKSCAVNLLPIGTVILSSRAPIGKVAIAGAPMYCNQGFKNIIPNGKIDSVYLYELLTMETEYLNSLGRGATFKEISKQIVENIRIKVPPIEIQRDFSNFVKQVDKSKAVVQESLDETQLLFDSLMQKYFG